MSNKTQKDKTRWVPIDKKVKYKNSITGQYEKIQCGELVNPRRRFIKKVCKELDITKKQFRKKIKNDEFANEVEKQYKEYKNNKEFM